MGKIRSWLTLVLGSGLAALVLFVAFGLVRFGSLSDEWSFLTGRRVLLSPMSIELRAGDPADTSTPVTITVRNIGFDDVSVYGTDVCCGAYLEGLPVDIQPLKSTKVRFEIPSFREKRIYRIFTSSPCDPELYFTVIPSAALGGG